MPTKTQLQLLQDAAGEELPRAKAEELEVDVRDLITALENVADALDAYATTDRSGVASARENLASDVGDCLSDLRSFGFQL